MLWYSIAAYSNYYTIWKKNSAWKKIIYIPKTAEI